MRLSGAKWMKLLHKQLPPIVADLIPALIATAGERVSCHFFEFFTTQIRNPHTCRA